MFGASTPDGWMFSGLAALTLVGMLALSLRRRERLRRRRASLRRDERGWYVWVECDGSTARSRDRPDEPGGAWDDGGDGGDGGD